MCLPSDENSISDIEAMISVKNDLDPFDPPSCNL